MFTIIFINNYIFHNFFQTPVYLELVDFFEYLNIRILLIHLIIIFRNIKISIIIVIIYTLLFFSIKFHQFFNCFYKYIIYSLLVRTLKYKLLNFISSNIFVLFLILFFFCFYS